MTDVNDIVRLGGQHQEIIKRVGNGSLDAATVREAYQQIIEGKFVSPDRFVEYRSLLLPIYQQWSLICRYNKQYWGEYFSDDELNAFRPKMEGNHEQSIEDLMILHVEFGSLQETIEMWLKVFIGEQPDHRHSKKFDGERYGLLPTHVATYPPKTITRVRINLVAHWDPELAHCSDDVLARAEVYDAIMAQAEVMSALGLHQWLFCSKKERARALPLRVEIPGIRLFSADSSNALTPFLELASNRGNEAGNFSAHPANDYSHEYSAPMVIIK
jgi:hypothetical protein